MSQNSSPTPVAPQAECGCSCSSGACNLSSPQSNDQEAERKSRRREVARLIIASVLFLIGLLGRALAPLALIGYLGALVVSGWPVFLTAARRIVKGHGLDESFLMSIASLGAVCIGQYAEGAAVMLFYQVGEFLQERAVASSRRSIDALLDIRPRIVHLLPDVQELDHNERVTDTPSMSDRDPHDIKIGAFLLIKPGEQIPLDGIVAQGSSSADTSLLTGESYPRTLLPGDEVSAGFVNGGGLIIMQTTATDDNSALARIMELVVSASERKSTSERFISRFARIYTPCVVGAAAIIGLAVPAVMTVLGSGSAHLWQDWISRALVLLVVSCPCALVLSVPLAYFAGLGACARQGVLVKGAAYLETLAKTTSVVFDKTGTLTQGRLSLISIEPNGKDALAKSELLALSAGIEETSNHPLAKALIEAAHNQGIDPTEFSSREEQFGRGVTGIAHQNHYALGNATFMHDKGVVDVPECTHAVQALCLYLSCNKQVIATILMADKIKDETPSALARLHEERIETIMLSGDTQRAAHALGEQLGLTLAYGDLLPEDKVARLEELIKEHPEKTYAFCGDGVNDAPALMRADVGIAMGGLGSDAAVQAADIVLTDDNPAAIPQAIARARKTVVIARENAYGALIVKFAILVLGALGLANMWLAVFADVGVSLIAVVNALRALKGKAHK